MNDKRKPGRPAHTPNNPFDASQEAEYLAWEHGFNSLTEDDNPYQPEDESTKEAYRAWLLGFKTKRSKTKTTSVNSINASPDVSVDLTLATVLPDLKTIPTEVLEAEIKERKRVILEQLLKQREELTETLNAINNEIDKLNMGIKYV